MMPKKNHIHEFRESLIDLMVPFIPFLILCWGFFHSDNKDRPYRKHKEV